MKSLSRDDRRQIGVQSVEVAARLLKTLAQLGGPQTLKDFSAAAGLSPAKARRYLVSLIRESLIEQSAIDGRYGPSKSIDVSSNGKPVREPELAAKKFVSLIG